MKRPAPPSADVVTDEMSRRFLLAALCKEDAAMAAAAERIPECVATLERVQRRREAVRNLLRCMGHDGPATEAAS